MMTDHLEDAIWLETEQMHPREVEALSRQVDELLKYIEASKIDSENEEPTS